ncbi:MAG: hypothetical protein NTX84_09005 [Nitrospirae bacterium]|nr:hypothetical protein [Nitrospirota bacterium]
MNESEIAELQDLIAKRRWSDVSRIVERLSRRKLNGSLFPVFLPLLTVKDYVIYKYAIMVVGKMRQPPADAFDAVLAAWRSTWLGGCPQCTIEALQALQQLDRTDPRIIDEITRCLAVDNYQVHKTCAAALMSINNESARQVLQDFETYLPRQYTEKLMVDLLAKIRDHLAA